MQLVLDTNIIISAFISPYGKPSYIMKMILGGKAKLCYNSIILNEYERVALRPKFSEKIDSNNILRFFDIIRSIGISFNPHHSNIKMPDESDRIFYDTAKESKSILITGNLKHFPKEAFIMSPSDFLKRFNG
ncbi:MAG: putative toxin-antitoxin system toxin component, PIN family [Leptospirales bacterium]|nr:putative toxin-antitoxin system toxin component, PIN family [Leptospirales bacterium]